MSRKINLKGVVPEDTHAQLMKGHWKYHGGGVSKAKGLIFQRGSLGRKGGGLRPKNLFLPLYLLGGECVLFPVTIKIFWIL